MLVNDFVNLVKREQQYGAFATIVNGVVTSGTISDQQTFDILTEVNVRRKRVWAKWDWKWTMEPLSIPVTPNVSNYLVTATSGNAIDRIRSIIPNDPTVSPPVLGAPLQEMEVEDFYAHTQRQWPNTPSQPTRYCNLGQNAAGVWQIMIWPTPSVAFTMTGYAKGVLKTFTLADLTAGTAFDYFPDGVVESILLDGVAAGIKSIKNDLVGAAQKESMFEAGCKLLVGEQAGVARDNSPITTPPPPWWASRNRMRSRRGTGVY